MPNDIVLGVFRGKYTTKKLPKTYYRGVASDLMGAVSKGMGGDKTFTDLRESLDLNAQAFAGAKTYNLVKELQVAAQGVKRFSDFETIGNSIVSKFDNWGDAETNTALQQTLQAKQWQVITEDSDLFPLLKYSTIGDACLICRPLDGIVAPVNSPIWRKIYPCNHYNCYCIVTQETQGSADLTEKGRLTELAADSERLMSPVFLSNAGITKELFTKDHPYFDIPKADRNFAKQNFGLPVK